MQKGLYFFLRDSTGILERSFVNIGWECGRILDLTKLVDIDENWGKALKLGKSVEIGE